jgi:hypothetical protein
MHKAEISPSHPSIIEEEERFVPSKGWAEMIRKVYEVIPILYPECGAEMKIIDSIEDHKVFEWKMETGSHLLSEIGGFWDNRKRVFPV